VSDDGAEKRFDPTPSRLARAKREGNTARSNEATGTAAFAGAIAALVLALPLLGALAATALRSNVGGTPDLPAVCPLVLAALWPAASAAVCAILVTAAQSGGVRITPVTFNLAKLAPLKGLQRMVGGEAAVGAIRAILAFGAVVAFVVPIAIDVTAAAEQTGSPLRVAALARDGALRACVAAAVVGAIFAAADYALARRRWLHGLKMTFEAFKRDMKEQDGDPQAKARRRTFHRAFARGGVARTRDASFVVVNPTHVAIALRYAPPAVPVPEILVRATDALAAQVRSVAAAAGVPIVENAPLARLLFRIGESGRPIPAETFVPVAEVIAALVRAGAIDA
jgi:flagellar biosynthesis protein FlhB